MTIVIHKKRNNEETKLRTDRKKWNETKEEEKKLLRVNDTGGDE
jgi:hypothetical protein